MDTSDAPCRDLMEGHEGEGRGDEVEVRCIMRVPGEPDKPVVARMPAWAAPRKGGRK